MKLSIVIPHYNQSSYRERNLLYTVEYYAKELPDVPIIVIEQIDSSITGVVLEELSMKYGNINHVIFAADDNSFRKAALINEAVWNVSDSEYIAMIDNDCILRDVTVEKLLPINECSVYIPYNSINFLRESHTRQLLRKGSFTQSKPLQDLHISKYTGGINVFSRDTFDTVGGFDEAFVNWGAEDDAFHIKCKRLVGPIDRIESDTELLHIWHPSSKTLEYTQSAPYMRNKKRVACIKRMSIGYLKDYATHKGSSEELEQIVDIMDAKNLLTIMVKVRVGNGDVTMDSTVYEIEITSDGEVTLSDILECVYVEEGPEFVLGVINQIRGTIDKIDMFSEMIFNEFEARYVR